MGAGVPRGAGAASAPCRNGGLSQESSGRAEQNPAVAEALLCAGELLGG